MARCLKPKECEGCPFLTRSKYYVPNEIRAGSQIFLHLQCPDETDEEQARPMCGRMGHMTMGWLQQVGLKRENMSIHHVIQCRPDNKNVLPTNRDGTFTEETLAAARHCTNSFLRKHLTATHHSSVQPNMHVLCGELAATILAGKTPILSWRGSCEVMKSGLLTGRKVLYSLHPEYLFKDQRYRTAMRSDFARIGREAKTPQLTVQYRDSFQLMISVEQMIELLQSLTQEDTISLDIETTYCEKPIDARLRIVGIGWSKEAAANLDWRQLTLNDQTRLLKALSTFDGKIVTATPYDYAVLTKYGAKFRWENCHDLTLLHSRYDIELPHTLEFIASMWTDRNYWKWMSGIDQYEYNGVDCAAEWEAWDRLLRFCRRHDPAILPCYEADRMMLPVCVAFDLNGLPFHEPTYYAEKAFYETRRKEIENEVSTAFDAASTSTDATATRTTCDAHPRYTGKSPVGLRKDETDPCGTCQRIRDEYLSAQPLNLRARSQFARKLKEAGMVVPKRDGKESVAKGAIAAMAKKYNDVRLIRFLKFKEDDTVVTRYFNNPHVTVETGRIHSNYGMHGAKHRWHSTSPNAQQFKRPEE